ncbi:glycosyltransferase [Tardiphaga sp. vice352]|nr:glycosyltransferase [Tardiphaga sp. vice278]QDM19754.1 glycosyltransferase [Tardiphaga sp. vice154]QDM29947.1 glycosyltransferase [Tardiphaga sp. vice352]
MDPGDHVESRPAQISQRPRGERPLPSSMAAAPRAPDNDNCHHGFDEGAADELDCLRGVLAPRLLQQAEIRARELGIGADQVLIRLGMIDEAAYLRLLSRHTGMAIDDLSECDRSDVMLRDDQITYAAASGLVPLHRDGERIMVIAPRNYSARAICRAKRSINIDFRLTSDYALRRFLLQEAAAPLIEESTRGLGLHDPAMSAAPAFAAARPWRGRFKRGAAVFAIATLPPFLFPAIWGAMLAVWFLAFTALRLATCAFLRQRHAAAPVLDDQLPNYSVIVALYREASSVAPLVLALEALDYPREKLDIILVVEPDDLQTRAAIARLGTKPHLRMLVAPAVAPQTKPKALNWALPFARGSFTAVYDAEDRPEPGQLRAALKAFRAHGREVACAQASLCIDNETHSLLSRMFTVEYAGHFDVMLPGMTAMGLPLPLGGSSNHFRTAMLRTVGAWDAYNVTEDADLGFRLARFGYRSVAFPSTTFEEAPLHLDAWLRQRSRWMKGWLQTWCVHMCHPVRLWREAGGRAFFTLNIVAGGNVVTALAYPIMLYAVIDHMVFSRSERSIDWATALHVAAFAAGCISTVALGGLGMMRRRRLRDGWILGLTPLYWICLSTAAWRAVWQFIWKPYHWEKTEHGLATRRTTDPAPRLSARRSQRQPHR